MEAEKNVLSRLQERFPAADTENAAITNRRVYVSIPLALMPEALAFAAKDMGFAHLCAITGLDTGGEYEFLYHVSGPEGIVLTLKCRAPGGDGVVIPSALPVYPGATFYERELEGLLGVKVDGLPEGRQYPLPDNWPEGEFPMRKDWSQKENTNG